MMKASLDGLAQEEDIKVIWRSFQLRPEDAVARPAEQEEAYRARIAAAWPRTSQMARENFGVEMISHRWGVRSRLALEGAKYAEAQGFGEAFHEAMFKAHFIEDRDFGDLQTLGDLAADVGLGREDFLAALESGAYAEAVDFDVAQARAYGLNGVPATIIQDKYLVSGAQPLAALQNIVAQIKAQESND